jgi:hypothetical protein
MRTSRQVYRIFKMTYSDVHGSCCLVASGIVDEYAFKRVCETDEAVWPGFGGWKDELDRAVLL